MWACYESIAWLRSPEYAGGWCAFWLGVFLWVLATRGRDPATRLFRQGRWVVAAQLVLILGAMESGRWTQPGKVNPSDLYTIASIALAAGWGVQLLLLVRLLRTRNESEPEAPFKVGATLFMAVGLSGALAFLAFVWTQTLVLVFWAVGGFSVFAFEVLLVLAIALTATVGRQCLSSGARDGTLLGASIGLMVGAVPISYLGQRAAETQVFALTDGCAADQFLLWARDDRAAQSILDELSRRDRPRFATMEATLRALHRSIGTKEPPGEYILPENLTPVTGEGALMMPRYPYHGPEAALLRVQVDRGLLAEPTAWLRDRAIAEETRWEVADAICKKTGLTSEACVEAKKGLEYHFR